MPLHRGELKSTAMAVWRSRFRMTRVQFAVLLGVAPTTVFGWEKGSKNFNGVLLELALEAIEEGQTPSARRALTRAREMGWDHDAYIQSRHLSSQNLAEMQDARWENEHGRWPGQREAVAALNS